MDQTLQSRSKTTLKKLFKMLEKAFDRNVPLNKGLDGINR